MPNTITLMSWNLENFGEKKLDFSKHGSSLVEYIANVISFHDAAIVGLLEIRGDLGQMVADCLVDELNGLSKPNIWSGRASPQFCSGRKEQYVLLWDTSKVATYTLNINGVTDSFQHQFANPDYDPANPAGKLRWIGFPRQRDDRPPWLGYFQTVQGSILQLPVAIFHAPGPDSGFVSKACLALSKVQEFSRAGAGLVIMGDFNVKASDDSRVAGSNGAICYGPLLKLAQPFKQQLFEQKSSLIMPGSALPGMTIPQFYSQPYDNIFFRTTAASIAPTAPTVVELLSQSLRGQPLVHALAGIAIEVTGNAPKATVDNVFQMYRGYVSDHMPVSVEITY